VAVANRVGFERLPGVDGDGLEFWGQSFVAGPSGQLLAKATVNQDEMLIVQWTCPK